MSVLLIGPSGSMGEAVFERLKQHGDDVRVIEDSDDSAKLWKARGGFVALAREWDADLIERASYEARTIVVFPRPDRGEAELLEEVIQGAKTASLERIVVIREDSGVPEALRASEIDHVVLRTGKASLFRRSKPVDDAVVAAAVDAADDLGGHPRLEVDLTREEGRALLGL